MKGILLCVLAIVIVEISIDAQPLTVGWKTERPPEMDVLRFLEIQFAGGTFSLVPPWGCGLKTDPAAATIQLSSSTGSVSMTIQFSTNSPSPILGSKSALQHYASPNRGEAEVRDAFPAHSGAATGKGIELSFDLHGQPMRRRAAVIPLPNGYAGFIVTSSADESKAAQQFFDGVVTSFHRR